MGKVGRIDDNLEIIVDEYEPMFGGLFKDDKGEFFTLLGILICKDDYYYLMHKHGSIRQLSCVGTLESHGYQQVKVTSL